MKNVIILEKQTESLSRVDENISPSNKYLLGGVFTEFNVLNRNQRIYTAEKFLPALDGLVREMNELGVVYGELDHPENFDSAFQRTSHALKTVNYVSEKNRVEGSIHLLGTQWGKEAKAIIDDGYPIFVSSRAAGVTNEGGNVEIKKLFTYDIVSSPGFASAKMSSINENLGFTENVNFRIYEIENESKINELFNMNKNDQVTKKQLSEYSDYMISEIKKTKKDLEKSIKEGKEAPKKVEQLLEYYDSLNTDYTKLTEYINYLTKQVSILVSSKKSTDARIDKLIEHNDYLATNLEKSIEYSSYLAEQLDNSIVYSEYIAENLDNSIEYSEYIAENLDNSIEYSEYIAENLDNSIEYSEYIAENLDNSIEYSEYIAENLDNSIEYGDYIAEQLETSVQYSKKIASVINESNKIFENNGEAANLAPTPEEFGFENVEDDDEFVQATEGEAEIPTMSSDEIPSEEMVEPIEGEVEMPSDVDVSTTVNTIDGDTITSVIDNDTNIVSDINTEIVEPVSDVVVDNTVEYDAEGNPIVKTDVDTMDNAVVEEPQFSTQYESKVGDITKKIDALLEKVKIQTIVKNTDYNFLRFLNKPQVDAFYALSDSDREKVVVKMEENQYWTSRDVLTLMNEAVSKNSETFEERLVRLLPSTVKDIYEGLDADAKKYYLLQANFHPNLSTDLLVEHFWVSRDWNVFTKKVNEGKTLLNEDKVDFGDKLSEAAILSIMNKMKNL